MLRYFISDLHLQAQRPEITEALLYFLEAIAPGADELYLLGDLFEAWIGDDYVDPVVERVAPAFAALHLDGTQIYLMHGNRDFLLGQQGAASLSATLLPSQHHLKLQQGSALLMHGDELCLDDVEYQAFRRMVRAPEWQKNFLARPLQERLAIARQLRETSQAAGAMKSDEIMDVSHRAVMQAFREDKIDLLIHGHTHRPARHQYTQGERIVLGDWGSTGWYLRADETALVLKEFRPD